MTPSLTLYHYWRSSCSWRVRWALNIKKINYKSIHVDLLKDEHKTASFLAMNPRGFVPVLQIGEACFGESMAILEWLEESYPSSPLLPTGGHARVIARQLAYNLSMGTQPIQNQQVMRAYSQNPEEQKQWAKTWIERGLMSHENLLLGSAGTYSVGSEISFADLCLIPQCYNAIRFGVDLGAFPTCRRIYETCLKTTDCDLAAPHRFEPA